MAGDVRCSQSHPNHRTARMYPILLLILFTGVHVRAYVDPDRGPFCERAGYGSSPMCCQGRHDNCSMPRGYGLMETVCYCDSFCVDTHRWVNAPDCCPDYRRVCLGEQEPTKEIRRVPNIYIRPENNEPEYWMVIKSDRKECFYKGFFYGHRTKFEDNCNICECVDMANRMEIMCTQKTCLVDEAMIDHVNRQRRGWTAGNITKFWKKDLEDGYNGMLGTNYSSKKVRTMTAIRSAARKADLPVNFDWRRNQRYITPIVDQRFCNASWSYSLVSMFSDRLAKSTRGRDLGPLSYQQHRTCVKAQRRNHPCNSGHLTRSQRYLTDIGLVKESCYPSSMDTRCSLDGKRLSKKTVINCPSGGVGKLYRATVLSRIAGESAIMKEIIEAGPVVATMRVFPDFFVYKNGVYNCGSKQPKHGRLHSVKIIGWGEDYMDLYGQPTLVEYWIAANSWGTDWGEEGFFKIRRGKNECDIEEFIISFYTNTKRLKRSVRPKNPFLVNL